MSDDLTERLRDRRVCSPAQNSCRNDHVLNLAEARIEELEAENRLLRDAVYIDDLTVTMLANDRSKAAAGIGRALGFLDADMPTEAKTALCITLAELKGETDE